MLPEDYPRLSLSDRWYLLRQTVYPKRLLSMLVHGITRIHLGFWKNWMISRFIQIYQVNMDHAQYSRPEDYEHFNAFFTRALKPSARPLALHQQHIISPVDGTLSQFGRIDNGYFIQAKGRYYSAQALLGGDPKLAQLFHRGSYLTLYLAPRDYHRVHMPCSGTLQQMIHIPGSLFSVSPRAMCTVGQLFTRNERVVSLFGADSGTMAIVLIGAVCVGCIEHTWHGVVTSPRKHALQHWRYPADAAPELLQGEEMGRFNMGSTVVLLFSSEQVSWLSPLRAGQALSMGEAVGAVAGGDKLTSG